MRSNLHLISARANPLELLDRNSGAQILISAPKTKAARGPLRVIRDRGGPPASPATAAMPPKAEVNSERRRNWRWRRLSASAFATPPCKRPGMACRFSVC